jgi:hypothetical protein
MTSAGRCSVTPAICRGSFAGGRYGTPFISYSRSGHWGYGFRSGASSSCFNASSRGLVLSVASINAMVSRWHRARMMPSS